MTIDVISDSASAPILVGDEADMLELKAVGVDAEGRRHLVMNDHRVTLSDPASQNFRAARNLLLVNVADGRITRARKVKIDNLDDGFDLSGHQCRALAKALDIGNKFSPREFRTAALAEFQSKYPDLAAA